jgi:PAS domain S-box-containing protein
MSEARPEYQAASAAAALITDELANRPARDPDFRVQSEALLKLAGVLADTPENLPQELVTTVVELCRADSAAISIHVEGDGGGSFCWQAVAGVFTAIPGEILPVDQSPGRLVAEHDAVLLFDRPQSLFPFLSDLKPPLYESLLAPFRVEGGPVGTIWAMSHSPERHFDAEDARLLASMCSFASAGHRLASSLAETTRARNALEQRVAERTVQLQRELTELRQAEVALRFRGEQFETLLDRAPIGVYLVDADFRISHVNPVALPVFGEIPGGVIGRDLGEILHILWNGAYADEVTDLFRHTLRTGESYVTPERAESRADRSVTEYYRWRIDRITLPDGRYGAVCYFQDISEEVEARMAIAASAEKYRTLFESIDEAFCVLEVIFDEEERPVDCRYLEVNPSFRKQVGMRDALGRTTRELVPNIEQFWFDRYGEVALTGIPTRFIDHAVSIGRWYDVYAFRVGQPEERRVAVLFNDITERKLAELALWRSEERQAFLLRLSDAIRPLSEPNEIQSTATRVLGEHLRASRAHYAEISADGRFATIGADATFGGVGSLVGEHEMARFTPLQGPPTAGKTVVCHDVATTSRFSEEARAALQGLAIESYIAAPLVKAGRLVALLSVQQDRPRSWTTDEIAIVEEVAERTWAAVERARAEAALRTSEARYRSLFESIDEGFCVAEPIYGPEGRAIDFRFLEVNPAFEKQAGFGDVVGSTALEKMRDLEPRWIERLAEVVRSGRSARFESHVASLGRWFDVFAFRVEEPGTPYLSVLFTDISERKRTEAALRELNDTLERRVDGRTAELARANRALRESEAKYRTLFETMDEGFFLFELILDETGGAVDSFYLEANPAAARMTGGNWVGRRLSEVDPGFEPYWLQIFGRVARTGRGERLQRYAEPLKAWYDFYVFPVEDGERPRVAIIFRDITDQRWAEEARQTALRQLVTAEEDERGRISRELHDSVGQLVTGLLLGLKALERPAPQAGQIEDLERLADRIAREMQHLALELRPPALDTLGLEVALQNHLEEWSTRHGIEADFHSAGMQSLRLPPEIETALYRVAQEGLTNCLKHARATHVSLVLERRAGTVSLIVEDDGSGFDVQRTLTSPEKANRLGIRGMRERLALLNGELEIESAPGSGTTIFARIPVPAIAEG